MRSTRILTHYVGTDGFLHIVARNPIQGPPAAGNYTSARLKTQGLFSFRYGRMEVRAKVPEAQGFWPAAWLLGNNIASINWPGCGEQDVMERVNAATTPTGTLDRSTAPDLSAATLAHASIFPLARPRHNGTPMA